MWTMFIKIFLFTFVTTYVTAELPPYIQVCGIRNPKLDECIMNTVNNLRSKLCEGIPELDVIPIKELHLRPITISKTDSIKLYLKNAQVYRLCDYVINDFHVDLDKLYFKVSNLLFKHIYFNATYYFDIHVLMPIATTGDFSFTSNNVIVNSYIEMKTARKNGKKHMYLSKLTLNIKLKEFQSQFENNNSEQMQQIIENFIGNNQEEIIAIINPALEEVISETILSISNNIIKHFTFDEIFPDRI